MRKTRLFQILFMANILMAGALLGGFAFFTVGHIKQEYHTLWRNRLDKVGSLISHQIHTGALEDSTQIHHLEMFRRDMGVRLTVIDRSGRVIFETDTLPNEMENHASRPEVIEALGREVGFASRYSATISREMLYRAQRVERGERVLIVRVAMPVQGLDETLQGIYRQWLKGGAFAMLVAILLAALVSLRIVRPVHRLIQGAERFAQGKLEQKIADSSWYEIDVLAKSMNHMAGELSQQIRSAVLQKHEMEAVLGSLLEGVVALDLQGRIFRANQAFLELLGDISMEKVVGQPLTELVRNRELDSLLADFYSSARTIQRDVEWHRGEQPRMIRVRGSGLRDIQGALIVFQDVTRIRKLEEMRSDFVANVSHELKTPITSIKGYVETLHGMDSIQSDDMAVRFLETVQRHTDRLNAIIDDLLTLSKIEQDGGILEIDFGPVLLDDLVDSVVQTVDPICQSKEIQLSVHIPENLQVQGNPGLLEQAITNLVTNACKYSDSQKEVRLDAYVREPWVALEIRDQGFGIERKHLDRIFERFYRVDKARSRDMGGTGLGLAITKHIILLHRGHIQVESEVGKGSVFKVVLPMTRPV